MMKEKTHKSVEGHQKDHSISLEKFESGLNFSHINLHFIHVSQDLKV